jgi:hypothetical protein
MIGSKVVVLVFVLCAAGPISQIYRSPDRAVSAEIVIAGPTDCESKVTVRDGHRVLVDISYVSADHDHGQCVDVAEWSRDSQFFVYSVENAGGHQGWHDYIMVFSRTKGQLLSLDHYVPDPITSVRFRLFGSHTIEFETTRVPLGSAPPHKIRMDLSTLNVVEP